MAPSSALRVRVGVRMAEGGERLGRSDVEPERVAAALVLDGDEQPVRPRAPEQRHVDTVITSAIQLAGSDLQRRAHDLLLSPRRHKLRRRSGSKLIVAMASRRQFRGADAPATAAVRVWTPSFA